MLSISNFKEKLVNLVTNQEKKVAETAADSSGATKSFIPEEKDAAVILMAENGDLSLDFDDEIKMPGTQKDTMAVYGNNKSIQGGDGSQQFVLVGDKNTINAGLGNDDILALGNNLEINSGDGNNSVVFKGNNLNITTGNGNDNISSLDFAIMQGQGLFPDYSKFENFLKSTKENVFHELVGNTIETKEVSRDVKVTNTVNSVTADIFSNLSAQAQEIAKGLDFNEMVPGQNIPMYVIAQGTADGEQWHIYKYQSGNDGSASYRAYGESVSSAGDSVLSLSVNDLINNNSSWTGVETTTVTVVTQDYKVNRYADYLKTTIAGNDNIKINDAGGDSNMFVNAKNVDIKAGNGNNNISVLDGLIVKDDYKEYNDDEKNWTKFGDAKTKVNVTEVETEGDGNVYSTAARAYDPIIVDFNRDGKVSASQGKGVDLDGDGIADGSASKGDKMLAMSDLNGNGKIDGSDVFGDQTVSPFSGQKLNAANGFEALAMIAREAEQYTGIKCLDSNGNVNLAELKKALNRVGVNIGFISESNVTELEDLAHVASINVSSYTNIDGVNLQTGYYTDNTGTQYKANDVWFKSKAV